MEEQLMSEFFRKSPIACAFQKVILDDKGIPCNYKFTDVNKQFEKISGLNASEIINKTFDELVKVHNKEENKLMKNLVEACINGESFKIESYDQIAEKYFRVFAFPISKNYIAIMINDGTEQYAIDSKEDEELRKLNLELIKLAQELKEKNEALEFIANRDKLTGLYNRHFFDQIIDKEMDKADINNEPMSLILFDLDHFKHVNDTWGHPTGDVVLKTTAEIAGKAIRKLDTLFRWGGEEFIILMPNTTDTEAILAAEKIRVEIEKNIFGEVGHLTSSFGVAERSKYELFRNWYTKADEAVYSAKEEGRNRVVKFSEEKRKSEPAINIGFKWRKEWETGDSALDDQHYKILEKGSHIINKSFSGMKSKEFEKELELLLKHVKDHFAYEEEFLKRIKYPNIKEHSELHKELMAKTLRLKKYYEAGELKRSDLFAFIFDDVIVGHLMEQDVLFFSYAKNNYK